MPKPPRPSASEVLRHNLRILGGLPSLISFYFSIERPLSNHRAQFSNILCQQASEPITMALSTGVIVNNCRQARHVVRMLAADWTRAHALAQRPFLKGQTSAGFSKHAGD